MTVTGTDLGGATTVYFGTVSASISGNTATQITVTSPAHMSATTFDITVTTAAGTSAAGSTDRFTYQALFSKASTLQYSLTDSDGATWVDMDSAGDLTLTVTPGVDMTAVLGGNSDLWTKVAGYNQDIGIDVNGTIVSWKESGGFAGTFSPNAAFVQTVISMSAGSTYTIKLRWKTNKPALGVTIRAGAGPRGPFSPTRITAQLFPATSGAVATAVSTLQYSLTNNDGVTWIDMDATTLSLTITPSSDMTAVIGGNADLWTKVAGYNQDIGINVNGAIVAWKESGGFAGTFSPNAAFVETTLSLSAGTTYVIRLSWKTNKASTPDVTIRAGAGPHAPFSPTRLTVVLQPASANAVQTAVSTAQYSLTDSDGVTWVDMDPNLLSVTIKPTTSVTALIGGNSDLWTKVAGFN